MDIAEDGAHVLVFPYPAQGHMIPLLNLTHQLAIRGLTITILVTPKNLPHLNSLLSTHPSIQTLVLPFPTHPSIPPGVENVIDLPAGGFGPMMQVLSELYKPILQWFQTHASPPVAIISDLFLGWTHSLAGELGIRRYVFSPSGALALSVIYALWTDLPKRKDQSDANEIISFPKIPNCPSYHWRQISPVYRSYVDGPSPECFKEWFLHNIASWGIVLNSFTELDRVYLDYLKQELGHDKVWAIGPLLTVGDYLSGPTTSPEIFSWLDTCDDRTVVYVSFGSQAVLTNEQMEELTSGLEKSQIKFILSVKGATKGHMEGGDYGLIPTGFEDLVAGRGLVVRWAPQVLVLRHRAVAAFFTHCGWNSVLEALVAGVPMLTWPMGADQYANDTLLVNHLKVGIRVCEGATRVPNSDELAKSMAKIVGENGGERSRAAELQKMALEAIEGGGSSFKNLDDFVRNISSNLF